MPYVQWVRSGDSWLASEETDATVPPGYYGTGQTSSGIPYLTKREIGTHNLITPTDSVTSDVVAHITKFWQKHQLFSDCSIVYKRGVLLYGPPGSGKSCAVQIIARDVIERGGIVILYEPSTGFSDAYRALRAVQPTTPIIVIMEDLDSLLQISSNVEAVILNLLDGTEAVGRTVFIATTNYPEKLKDRIVNRPSRFDLVLKVPVPSYQMRIEYLVSMKAESILNREQVERYAKDTDGLGMAHVKELFVSTALLDCDYEETLQRITHRNRPSSTDDNDSTTGMFL